MDNIYLYSILIYSRYFRGRQKIDLITPNVKLTLRWEREGESYDTFLATFVLFWSLAHSFAFQEGVFCII